MTKKKKDKTRAVPNSLANTIDATEQKTRYDECVKRILAEKEILARILQGCAPEFKNVPISQIVDKCIEGVPQISTIAVDQDALDSEVEERLSGSQIEGQNTEDVSIREGKVFYDVRFSAIAPGEKEPIQLIVNVEAQNDVKLKYPITKRALYYVSRLISAQKNKVFFNSEYEKIRKVYSIWILAETSEQKQNTVTRYRIVEERLVGNASEEESAYDLLTVVMIRLGDPDAAESKSLLRFLDVLLSKELQAVKKKATLQRDFGVSMTTYVEKEIENMCSLAEGIWSRANEEGQKIGEKRGEKRGVERATLDHALRLMESLKMTAEDALNLLGVPAENRKALLKNLNERLAEE